jgi:DNA polymerase IV
MGRSADLPRESGQTDGDDRRSPILHVDMDAFFASVEVRRRPELRGRPVVVGGGTRGVVAAASYEARRYGVFSAMPMSIALRRCPRAVVLPVDRAAYVEASQAVMAILGDVTDQVEPLSLDEAFLDVSAAQRRLGRPADIARLIRRRVFDEQNLTCSVGIAPSKFVAKVASARCKPDGMLVVPADGVLNFLHPLPITALWGVGPSTAERLHRLGLRSVGDVAQTPVDVLARAIGTGAADHLSALANGIDGRAVIRDSVEKSVSSDRTFDTDLCTEPEVHRELLRLAEEVAGRLRARNLVARTVGIKVRFADFKTVSRVRTVAEPVDLAATLYAESLMLYAGLDLDRPRIRLLGVKAEGLVDARSVSQQLSFDDIAPPSPRQVHPTGASSARRTAARMSGDPGSGDPVSGQSVSGQSVSGQPVSGQSVSGQPQPAAASPADAVVNRSRLAAIERVADLARHRFGSAAVRKASLIEPGQRTDPTSGDVAQAQPTAAPNGSGT